MKNIILASFLLVSSCFKAQILSVKYFSNEFLEREVPEHKAKVSQTVFQNSDQSTTTETKDLKSGKTISSESYTDKEPTGKWFYYYGERELDYNFRLSYSDTSCTLNAARKIADYLKDDDALGYKAPKFSGAFATIYHYIAKNIFYPIKPKEAGISGKVFVSFTVMKDGSTSHIAVRRGAHPELDKEAARVLRQLKFSTPATLNGENIDFCFVIPISFKVQ